MGIFESRSVGFKFSVVMSVIVVGFVVLAWGLLALSDKYMVPNRIQNVVLAEVSIGVEATGIEEGVVRANSFCDEIKRELMEQGVEPGSSGYILLRLLRMRSVMT